MVFEEFLRVFRVVEAEGRWGVYGFLFGGGPDALEWRVWRVFRGLAARRRCEVVREGWTREWCANCTGLCLLLRRWHVSPES